MENISPKGQLMPDAVKNPLEYMNEQWSRVKENFIIKVLQDNRGEVPPTAPPVEPPATPPAGDPSLHNPPPIDPNAPPAVDPNAASSPTIPPEPPATPPPAVKSWYDGIESADIKANPKIQEFKDVDGLAKSYLELQTLLGHEKIALPKDENDEVAIAHLNKARGVPEAAENYELEAAAAPEGMEGMEFGDDMFKEIAFKHKLTPAQANGIKGDYVALLTEIQKNSVKGYTEQVEASKAELVKEWGLAYDPKVKLAQNVMNKFSGSKEAFDHINAKIGADPIALKFLATVGEQFAEGTLGNLGQPQTGFTKTPADAKKEYDQIMNDPNDIYWAGVRNQTIVSESVRKERISHVESLLKMQQPAQTS